VPDRISLEVLQVGESQNFRDGGQRHERMFHHREFDACEFGLSPYVMLIGRRQEVPFVALPLFPRRLFSQSQVFVRADSPITEPAQLIGRRVALRSFHTTLSVLFKGDLKAHYGVPWEEIVWCTSKPEMIEFGSKPGVRMESLPAGTDLGEALHSRAVDAVVVPHAPRSMQGPGAPVRRLFPDPTAEEEKYYCRTGFFPIMHIMVIRRDLLALADALVGMYDAADRICRSYYDDPNWSRLAWGRHDFEAEQCALPNAFPVGLEANRACLAQFIGYCADQLLIPEAFAVEDLFPSTVIDR
jgi:4,5-dihydroxyphthalate decarboxylase